MAHTKNIKILMIVSSKRDPSCQRIESEVQNEIVPVVK